MTDIKRLGINRREVSFPKGRLLVSYETPVAFYDGITLQVSDLRFSSSTTNHIWLWQYEDLHIQNRSAIPQENLDELLREATGDVRLKETASRLKRGYSGNKGRLENTEGIDYDSYREFKEAVVPAYRRSYKRRVDHSTRG